MNTLIYLITDNNAYLLLDPQPTKDTTPNIVTIYNTDMSITSVQKHAILVYMLLHYRGPRRGPL